jgi:hypothetical protein
VSGVTPGAAAAVDDGAAAASPAPGGAAESRQLGAQDPGLMHGLLQVFVEACAGEPDVIGAAEAAWHVSFFDCVGESPPWRRSLCYDRASISGTGAAP